MNAPLTHIIRMDVKKEPLIMEFEIDSQLAPVLVSSSKSLLWVEKIKQDRVRAAVREGEVDGLFATALEKIEAASLERGWDSVHPVGPGGLLSAINHLHHYDIMDVEVLVHPKSDPNLLFGVPQIPTHVVDYPVFFSEWLPLNKALVVPSDRDFLGFTLKVGEKLVSVIHNPARGLAITSTEVPHEGMAHPSPQ